MGYRGEWESNFVQYNIGDSVTYEGVHYKIIQPHRSQVDWSPSKTPDLWEQTDDKDAGVCSHYTPPTQQSAGYYQNTQQNEPPQYKSPQGADQSQQAHGSYTTGSGVAVPHEEAQKPWYDLDADKKKKLLEGGLVIGLAAAAGGFYLNHEHKKHGEEEKAQAWELQNWIIEARNRTKAFLDNGPQGPTTWIFSDALHQNPGLQADLIKAGHENGKPLFIARAIHNGSLVIGKAILDGPATIGYGNHAIEIRQYEILIGNFSAVRWVHASGKLKVNHLGAQPIQGGKESNGTPLFIARASHHDDVIPGKASSELEGCYITHGDKEKGVEHYEVLCLV